MEDAHSFGQYNTTKRWADYLNQNALLPTGQYVARFFQKAAKKQVADGRDFAGATLTGRTTRT